MSANYRIISVNALLKRNLIIPEYQRPYKWTIKNVSDLLDDISIAIKEKEKFNDFKYRIGTVILYEKEAGENEYEIVDGQQRIITLLLLKIVLEKDTHFECSLLHSNFKSKESQKNINTNYLFIKDWFYKDDDVCTAFKEALDKITEVVVIYVKELSEAFQLFDSQNTRGRSLDPHDLLKAHHLRAMIDNPYEMRHVVTSWEAVESKRIKELFDLYLFPSLNWARKNKCHTFTYKDIDVYKGIPETSTYTYAKRTKSSMPYFQIAEVFTEGEDFFKMVLHYLDLNSDISSELMTNSDLKEIWEIIDESFEDKEIDKKAAGFKYAKNLFLCALLFYYDRFHNFDVKAVKKLFSWAFMLRVDMESLGFDSVNKYAIGDLNDKYTNKGIPLFNLILNARKHTDIANIQIKIKRDNDNAASEKWNHLYKELLKLNGLK